MANMSYCRFQNTLSDLRDCEDNLLETESLSKDEQRARQQLIETCRRIVEAADDTEDDDEDAEDTDPETPGRYQ